MDTETTTDTTQPRLLRRVAKVAAVVLVLGALALTPPLLNVNRLQHRIATSMSESLGRPVHLDRVSLHLLPMPGFTLENLVVSEDPAFGSEPTIRANIVTVRLRLSSLWRRQVEISNIKFEVDEHGSGPQHEHRPQRRGPLEPRIPIEARVQIDTAPTVQTVAGPAPRFPYIEATNARVNLKLGDEKQPFSLTEADFALWLPSPQQWRVRLEAKPARTDTSINDPGTIRLEGSLNRAPDMSNVPVELYASWHDAPLGEASRVLTGNDLNWRGTLHLDASLTGTLGDATLTSQLTLNDVRRADFVPAKSLSLAVNCTGKLVVHTALINDPQCTVDSASSHISAIADTFDITATYPTGLRIGTANASLADALDWARLFSQRIPPTTPEGKFSGSLLYVPAQKSLLASWGGEFHGEVLGLIPVQNADTDFRIHPFSVEVTPAGATLAPFALATSDQPAFTLSATATQSEVTLHLAGTATPQQFAYLRALLPPVADGVAEVTPGLITPDPATPHPATTDPDDALKIEVIKIDAQCTRPWGGPQTCTVPAKAALSPAKPQHHRR